MPFTVEAKEIAQDSVPVMRQSEEAAEPCADLAKAKEACLAEGGDCAALVKSFVECMEAAKA